MIAAAAASILLPVEAASVPRLAAWLEARGRHLGLAGTLREALRVCAEEAATNIVRHAFPPGAFPDGAGAARFGTRLEADGEVVLAFEDEGIPFDPTRHEDRPTPASLEEAAIGGLGIRLIRGFARTMRYERTGGVNRLVLSFDRAAG